MLQLITVYLNRGLHIHDIDNCKVLPQWWSYRNLKEDINQLYEQYLSQPQPYNLIRKVKMHLYHYQLPLYNTVTFTLSISPNHDKVDRILLHTIQFNDSYRQSLIAYLTINNKDNNRIVKDEHDRIVDDKYIQYAGITITTLLKDIVIDSLTI